jgi:small GTP-binding protein
MNGHPFPQRYVPTIFESSCPIVELDGVRYRLQLWDTQGDREYDRLRPLCYVRAQAILLCFALDNRQSLRNLSERWLAELRHYCPKARIVLIGTKSDTRQLGNPDHVTDEEARQFLDAHNCAAFIPCSAKDNKEIDRILLATVHAPPQEAASYCLIM